MATSSLPTQQWHEGHCHFLAELLEELKMTCAESHAEPTVTNLLELATHLYGLRSLPFTDISPQQFSFSMSVFLSVVQREIGESSKFMTFPRY